MTVIYHNPRCSKSRECLSILQSENTSFETVKYIDKPLDFETLAEIIKKLSIRPIDLVRKKEAIWVAQFKGKDLSDKETIQAMIDFPKLMERPIVVNGNKAVIGRPPSRVLEIL